MKAMGEGNRGMGQDNGVGVRTVDCRPAAADTELGCAPVSIASRRGRMLPFRAPTGLVDDRAARQAVMDEVAGRARRA